MKKKYTSVEELAADESFQNYVLGTPSRDVRKWRRILKNKAELRGLAKDARMLVMLFSPSEKMVATSTRPRYLPLLAKIAASIILLAIATFALQEHWRSEVPEITKIARDGNINLHLSDLTEVTLRKGSSLTYRPTWENSKLREVKLEGEAYFDVTKGKPFHVFLDQGSVEVLGTKFLVRADSIHTEVLLEEGSVNFHGEKKVFSMIPGDLLEYSEEKVSIQSGSDIREYSSWSKNSLAFENTPLEKVIRVINNSYNLKIELSQDRLKDRKISTTIDQNDPLLLIDAIAAIYDIEVIKKDDKIILK